MGLHVCMGASMRCSMGMASSPLVPTPRILLTGKQVAATVLDHIPILNIPPFGLCRSPANPVVAAATAAALGVLTPMPCTPATPAPWAPGSPKVMLAGAPALNDSSRLMCLWAGVITIDAPGQTVAQIP